MHRRLTNHATLSCLGVAFFMASAASAQNVAEPPLAIGPLRMGMTYDEIRAALPQAEWKETTSPLESHYQKLLNAPAALELNGLSYDVRVTRGWHGAYALRLVRKAEQPNAARCLEVYEGMLQELQNRYGAFTATQQKYQRSALEVAVAGAGQTETKTLGESTYTLHSNAAYSEATATRAQGQTQLQTVGQYFVNSPLFGTSMCITAITFETPGKPPEFEEIDARALKTRVSPSIGLLHASIEGLYLTTPLTFKARCRLSRTSGAIIGCQFDDSLPRAQRDAANLRINEWIFATDNLDPGNPVKLFTQLEFRLDPAQQLVIGTPGNAIDAAQIEWRDARDTGEPIPSITANIKTGTQTRYETARATTECQVQVDGSLVCLDPVIVLGDGVVDDPVKHLRFEEIARERVRHQRAPATTRTGEATRGKWVRFQTELRLRVRS